MTSTGVILLAFGTLVLVCALATALSVLVPQVRQSRTAVRRRVVVNLTDGTAVSGVLYERRGALLVLRDASLIADSRGPQKMDGEAIVSADQISFVQALA